MQSGIHPLPTKRAMNVSSVASDEDTSDAQMRDVPVMDAKIAAPTPVPSRTPGARPSAGAHDACDPGAEGGREPEASDRAGM